MADNEQRRGAIMRPTLQEILTRLRATVLDLDCSTDEARAVLALDLVYESKEDVEKLRDEIRALRDDIDGKTVTLQEVLTAMVMSRHSGDRQAEAILERRLREIGVIKGRGQE